jgi:hypothetical protein
MILACRCLCHRRHNNGMHPMRHTMPLMYVAQGAGDADRSGFPRSSANASVEKSTTAFFNGQLFE